MSAANPVQSTNAPGGGILAVDESSMRTNKVEQVSSLLISIAVMLALRRRHAVFAVLALDGLDADTSDGNRSRTHRGPR